MAFVAEEEEEADVMMALEVGARSRGVGTLVGTVQLVKMYGVT